MQRKLSEIAEIPKILSSTLATVSQTFDKLVPGVGGNESSDCDGDVDDLQQIQRKYSYDEDAIDYALLDDDDDDGDVDSNVEDLSECGEDISDIDETVESGGGGKRVDEDFGRLGCKDLVKKLSLRDLTPESDYASTEGEDVEDEEDDDDEDEEDFLTTSFTWRLRKVPKLLLNDEPNDTNDEDNEEVVKSEHGNEQIKHKNNDKHKDEVAQKVKQQRGQKEEEKAEETEDTEEEEIVVIRHIPQAVETSKTIEKEEKLGPLERAWPWADRTKIIYKQSTCHLVPRQPLGIIEKSKQLLAKQNLFDKLKKR